MPQRVVPIEVDATWQPNAPDAVLVSTDLGRSALGLYSHPSDLDRRCVVLLWEGCHLAQIGSPNDEAMNHHPLYECGLWDVLWLGEVLDSERIAALTPMAFHPPHRHFIVLTKERMVEVVADSIEIQRRGGSTLEAASAALQGLDFGDR